jgi:hypothetical protein
MQLTDSTDKRDHTFGFYWYDEPHIFEWTQKDFDAALKEYADSGVNHIIDFSITHIRWSFYPWWDKINRAIEKLVKACHKNGIYLTEHHSAVLLFCPDTPQRVEHMEKRFFGKRNGSYKHWPGFIDNCLRGIEAGGKNLNDMFQIDPVSGKSLVVESYATNIICPNNQDFTPLYLNYLEDLYKLGIDGIMTDDIQIDYSSHNGLDAHNGCACEFCRAKFKQQTGYTLPACGDEWLDWRRKSDSPDFVSWIMFRNQSVRDFHVRVKEHYESLNLKLFRPNYSATNIYWTNPGAHCLDLLPALDWVKIENCFPHIKRYSWPEWMIEHNHPFALARYRQIPATAMFYPHRQDEVEFCWALALNSGLGYLGTANCEPIDLNQWEKPLRIFEHKHQASIKEARKAARVAFFFSRLTRDLYPGYDERSRENITSWMFACELENIPYDLLLPEELDDLEHFRVIVLNEAAVMSEEELEKFKAFVKNGGRIIWVGKNAEKDESFKRTRTFQDIWGFARTSGWSDYQKGRICSLDLADWTSPLRRRVLGPFRWLRDNEPNYDYQAPTPAERKLHRKIGQLINSSLPDGSDLILENAPDGLLCHLFLAAKKDHLLLHFLNAVGTLDKPESGFVMHRDPLPFTKLKEAICVTIRKPKEMSGPAGYSAQLCIPGQQDKFIKVKETGPYFQLELEPETLSNYALLKIGIDSNE